MGFRLCLTSFLMLVIALFPPLHKFFAAVLLVTENLRHHIAANNADRPQTSFNRSPTTAHVPTTGRVKSYHENLDRL